METLLPIVRVLPQFVWGRQNWGILRPFVTLAETEIADLESSGVFCAGLLDGSVRSRENLFDVLVDVSAREVTIAEHSKDDFRMGDMHKEVATFMVQVSVALQCGCGIRMWIWHNLQMP